MTTETHTAEKTAAVASQGAHVAPKKAPSKKAASHKKGAPKAKKTAPAAAPHKKAQAPRKEPVRTSTAPRAQSKGAQILQLIGRANGAALAEIMKATQWQAHSVRGFISTAAKRYRVKIESAQNDAGGRVYRLAK